MSTMRASVFRGVNDIRVEEVRQPSECHQLFATAPASVDTWQ